MSSLAIKNPHIPTPREAASFNSTLDKLEPACAVAALVYVVVSLTSREIPNQVIYSEYVGR